MAILKIYRSSINGGNVIVENIAAGNKQPYQAVLPNQDSTGKITLIGITTFNTALNGGQSLLLSDILQENGTQYPDYKTLVDTVGFRKANGGGGGSVSSVNATLPLLSSGGATPNISFQGQANGNYGLNFSGGVATFVPIQGETVGCYKEFAHANIPANYLWCNGAILPIVSYPDLFAEIGNTYIGGDGITTFAVPNLTGRFLQGDNGSNITTSDGSNTLLTSQLPQHRHSLFVNSDSANTDIAAGNYLSSAESGNGAGIMTDTPTNLEITNSNSISLSGGGVPHEHPHVVCRIAICFESVGINGASPTPSFNATLGISPDSTIRALLNGIGYATLNEILTTILTGFNVLGGSISATDTILQAFGKTQNQINGVLGGAIYQGTWNATTNIPNLTSSVGTKGFYYVVSVAGATNLNGITDWQLGDWAIFNGTVWEKVDNTDAVISVNGFTGAVVLDTSHITENTNLYFTVARVLATVLTGFAPLSGVVSASDSILQAIQKIVGNTQLNENATIIPTAASTTTLTIASNTKQIFTGSVFGKVLNLGNATTYLVGKSWFLKSNATQTISIVNNSNTEIYRLEPQCSLEVTLQDNTTANGVWLFNVKYPCSERMIGYNESFMAGTVAGQTNFAITSSGAGAGATFTTSIFGKNGAVTLSTGTTNTGRTCPNKNNNGILFGLGVTVLVKNIRFEDLSTAADRYVFYSGFGDNTAAGDMLDGVYFEYSEGTNGNFWVLKTSNNSTRSIVITTSPIVADTWYKLKIEVNELGTRADFFVNDVNVGNITNNIPTAAGRNTGILQKIEKTVGGIARLAYTNLSNFRNYPNQ